MLSVKTGQQQKCLAWEAQERMLVSVMNGKCNVLLSYT